MRICDMRARAAFSMQVCFKPGIGNTPGCRALTRQSLDRMCSRAKCTILHKISNDYLDAYVLSESSLFVYPRKASARVLTDVSKRAFILSPRRICQLTLHHMLLRHYCSIDASAAEVPSYFSVYSQEEGAIDSKRFWRLLFNFKIVVV